MGVKLRLSHKRKNIRRSTVFENKVLRNAANREEVAGRWRRPHNEQQRSNLCASRNISGVTKSQGMRWSGHAACMGEMRNTYTILVEKLQGKRILGTPRPRWENDIGIDLREIGWGGVERMHLTQDKDK
jgi:hypothetical protein